jgi:hypothetical protein
MPAIRGRRAPPSAGAPYFVARTTAFSHYLPTMNFTRTLGTLALLMVVPLSRLVAGCSSDECTAASDRYFECQPEPEEVIATTGSSSSSGGEGRPPACEKVYLCEARCVLAASCDALTYKEGPATDTYLKCIDDCRKNNPPDDG